MGIGFDLEREETVLGHFADRCRACDALTEHLAKSYRERPCVEIGLALLPYRKFEAVGVYARCASCGNIRLIDPADYSAFAPEAGLPWSQLQERTNPHCGEELPEDAELARRSQVVRVMLDQNQRIVDRLARGRFDVLGAVLMGSSLAWWATGHALGLPHGPWPLSVGVGMVFAPAVLLLGSGLYRLLTDTRRYCRRLVLPRMASELHEVAPSPDDVEFAFNKLSRMGARLVLHMSVDSVIGAIVSSSDPRSKHSRGASERGSARGRRSDRARAA